MSPEAISLFCYAAGGMAIGLGCGLTIRDRRISFWAMIVGSNLWSFLLTLYEWRKT